MKIQVHIGQKWGTPLSGYSSEAQVAFPEVCDAFFIPLTADQQIKVIENLLTHGLPRLDRREFDRPHQEFRILTLSPIVFDRIRVAKRENPDKFQVTVFYNGTETEVDRDGRMENFPAEFDVHAGLLCRLL